MSLRRALIEHFVISPGEPAPAAHEDFVEHDGGPDRACADPAPRTPPGVAVLSAPGDAHPLGAALGLALARRRGAAVVCVWSPAERAGSVWRAPAPGAARRLAASLVARGHVAVPAGRLVVVRLPVVAADAALHARRVAAAAGAAPTVLALGGPRAAAFDELLAQQDLVVVAPPRGTEPMLGRLALAGVGSPHARTWMWEAQASQPARALAASGLVLPPSMRRVLAGAVAQLP